MPTNLRIPALALAAALAAAAAARAGTVEVVKDAKHWGTLDSYDVGDNVYLGLKEAARVYGSAVYWYPVQGQVALTLHGRSVAFKEDSDEVSIDGEPVKMPRALLVRVGSAFAPVEFFTGPAFAEASGYETRFNAKTKVLQVEPRANVGPVRWFTYSDHTRVVLELRGELRYQAGRREAGGYAVTVPRGVVDSTRREDVKDGVVDAVELTQDSSEARLALALQEGAGDVQLQELADPRRVVIDVARRPGAPRHAKPAGATLAEHSAPGKPEAVPAPAPTLKPVPPPATSPTPPPAPPAPAVPVEAPKPVVAAAPAPKPAPPPEAPAVSKPSVEAPKPAAAPAPQPAPSPKPPAAPHPRYRIAVDAGHGGKDGGATGRRGTLEKDVNLAAALQLAKLLEKDGRFDVLLTRPDDNFVKLGDRAKKANEAHADLFVSLHSNAHPSRAESGFEVYFLSERASDPEAERLAEFENSVLELENGPEKGDEAAGILYQLARTEFINEAAELAGLVAKGLSAQVDLPDRGVKQASFYVLRGAAEPSILVEMGFLTNERDEAKLDNPKYLRRIVEGVDRGIVAYYDRRAPAGGGR